MLENWSEAYLRRFGLSRRSVACRSYCWANWWCDSVMPALVDCCMADCILSSLLCDLELCSVTSSRSAERISSRETDVWGLSTVTATANVLRWTSFPISRAVEMGWIPLIELRCAWKSTMRTRKEICRLGLHTEYEVMDSQTIKAMPWCLPVGSLLEWRKEMGQSGEDIGFEQVLSWGRGRHNRLWKRQTSRKCPCVVILLNHRNSKNSKALADQTVTLQLYFQAPGG